jgi:hypothetical protein
VTSGTTPLSGIDTTAPSTYLVVTHVAGDIRKEISARAACTTRKSRPGRRCGAGKRSCGSSPDWISSNLAWSRSLTGVLRTSRPAPKRYGFSAASAASRAPMQPEEHDAWEAAPARCPPFRWQTGLTGKWPGNGQRPRRSAQPR